MECVTWQQAKAESTKALTRRSEIRRALVQQAVS